jgi:hypothetical protein
MAQERIGFFGKFQAQAADTSGADRMRSLAGVVGQAGDLAFQIGAKKRTQEGKEAGLEEGRAAVSEGRATEKKGGGFGIFGNAYDQAAQGAYISSIGLDSKAKINQLAIDHADDPEAFAVTSQEYLKGVLANSSPEAFDVINRDVTNRITTIGGRLQSDFATKVINESNDTMTIAKDELAIEASTFARQGDSAGAEGSRALAFATIDQLVASGGMKGPKAAEAKRAITRDIKEQKSSKNFDDIAEKDGLPAAFSAIEDMRNDIPKGHSPEEWDTYISSAQTELGRKASRLNAMKEKETKEAANAVRAYKEATELGFTVDPIERARVQSLANTPELKAEFARTNRVAAFSVLPSQDRTAIVSSSQTGKLIDLEDYKAMTASNIKLQEAAKKDGYTLGAQQGIIEDIPFDATDPDSFEAKVSQAEVLSSHYNTPVSPLSDSEADALALAIDGMTPIEKTQLAVTLSASPTVWGQVAKKNQGQFAMVGAIGDPTVMQTVFRGQELIENKLNLSLVKSDYMPVFDDMVEDIYGADDKRAILDSVLSHYAVTGDNESFDSSDFESAIESVTGGVSKVNGFKVELPRGVDEDDFEDFIDDFHSSDVIDFGGVSGYTPQQASEAIQDGRIKSVGANRYHVLVNGTQKLMGTDGKPFTITYSKEDAAEKKAFNITKASQKFSLDRSSTAVLSEFAKRGAF